MTDETVTSEVEMRLVSKAESVEEEMKRVEVAVSLHTAQGNRLACHTTIYHACRKYVVSGECGVPVIIKHSTIMYVWPVTVVEVPEQQTAPVFTRQLEDRDVFETTSIRLECDVIGSPEPDITWYRVRVSIQ